MLVDPFNWKVFRYSFSVLHMTCAKPYHIFSIVVVVVSQRRKIIGVGFSFCCEMGIMGWSIWNGMSLLFLVDRKDW